MKIKFPKDFMWGGALASEQTEGRGEGKKGRTKWDLHFEKYPKDFFDGVGPTITSDFYHTYKEDIKMWKEIAGINSIRIGISWTRLFPDGKTLNSEAVMHYHNVLDEFKKYDIKVVVTLWHFDMPEWAIESGSWTNKKTIDSFVKFSEFVIEEFDSKIYMIATMNEPIVPIFSGYLKQGNHWPKTYNPQLAFDIGNKMILAHARVVNIFNSKKRKSKIGVVINVSPAHARNEEDPQDVVAAQKYHLIHNLWMLDPMIKGIFPDKLKETFKELGASRFILTDDELKEISEVKLDFVGTNFYYPTRLKKFEGDGDSALSIEKVATKWQDPNARMNKHRGWEIYPKDIYNTARLIMDRYDNIPFFISENGMGVQNEVNYKDESGQIQDDYRIAFVKEHLEWCAKSIAEGANLIGYHMWAMMDCWSWSNAYKNRYGFFEIDLANQDRRPKKSAHWFKTVIENNGFDDKYVKLDEIEII